MVGAALQSHEAPEGPQESLAHPCDGSGSFHHPARRVACDKVLRKILVIPGMIQPETWKAIGEYSGKVWTAVGPLVGVLIGAWLGRAWDSKKWQQENRKEECRELLTSISHAATMRLTVGHGHSEQEAYDAYLDSMRILHDRLFIAADIERAQLTDLWAKAVGDLLKGKIDEAVFSDRVSQTQSTIISFVVR